MVTLEGRDIPEVLNRLPQPPKRLYSTGNLKELLTHPRIAVVGSRKISPYGRAVTKKLVTELVNSGVVIVSGLALGTDSVAHTACLEAGGQTIAVLPSSINEVYPRSHANLAKQLVARGGALVSEYTDGQIPYKDNFLARNRIIAALSDAVLIPEAAARSGSLNTAGHALELGLPILAVPGNITSFLSEGTNNLIKKGAVPVTGIKDIYEALGWEPAVPEDREIIAKTPEELAILTLIKQGVGNGFDLLNQSGLEASKFNQTLTMLELQGRIRALGANHWGL